MGQTQSNASSSERDQTTSQPAIQPSPSPSSSPPPASSFEDLVAEATASTGGENEESLDVKAQKALECPCVAELRKGPCGTQFTEAFVCFIKSTAKEKGSDCVNPFIALQDCIKSNPDAFSKHVLGEEENESGKGEEEVEGSKLIAPSWSREPKSRN